MGRSSQIEEDHEAKPRRRYLLGIGFTAMSLALLVLILGAISCSPEQVTPTPEPEGGRPRCRKAALVDQVALTHPNPEFIDQALAYLREAGFSVDVYQGEEITVEFYRTLPTHGYELILLRTHATNTFDETQPDGTMILHPRGPVVLLTSEPYAENRYVREQLTDRVGRARGLHRDNSPLYFAIRPGFVSRDMRGYFEGALIIIGGCRSLGAGDLAEAFFERGASAVVGWNDWVDLSHNDQALLHLLRGLTTDKLALGQAVRKAMDEVGPDPFYESTLIYLTQAGGSFTLWDH